MESFSSRSFVSEDTYSNERVIRRKRSVRFQSQPAQFFPVSQFFHVTAVLPVYRELPLELRKRRALMTSKRSRNIAFARYSRNITMVPSSRRRDTRAPGNSGDRARRGVVLRRHADERTASSRSFVNPPARAARLSASLAMSDRRSNDKKIIRRARRATK